LWFVVCNLFVICILWFVILFSALLRQDLNNLSLARAAAFFLTATIRA
jgi:hypothetical protein